MSMPLAIDHSVPGGLAIVNLKAPAQVAYFAGQRILLYKEQAIIGIPHYAKPGEHTLRIIYGQTEETIQFKVAGQNHLQELIELPSSFGYFAQMQGLKSQEDDWLAELYQHSFSENLPTALQFSLPVLGVITSTYGLGRIYNKQQGTPHLGLDIAADTGTLIKAPLEGIVLAAKTLPLRGKTVILNHGQGLISLYAHLEDFAVKPGQRVKVHDVLGQVGHTGRATGPHLHWEIILNTYPVDPQLLLTPQAQQILAQQKTWLFKLKLRVHYWLTRIKRSLNKIAD